MSLPPAPFDVSKLEEEVAEIVGQRSAFAPQQALIEQAVTASAEDLGRITAEAIKTAHESAAKALDDLCVEIKERVDAIEQLKAASLKQIEECKELATQHRDAGKLMSVQVEAATNDLNEARDLIETMRKKIKAP